jgi:hypothetical protein
MDPAARPPVSAELAVLCDGFDSAHSFQWYGRCSGGRFLVRKIMVVASFRCSPAVILARLPLIVKRIVLIVTARYSTPGTGFLIQFTELVRPLII